MATYGEAQARIESLRQQLGIQPISFDDAQSKIVELNNQLAMMPMSRREYAEKRAAEARMPFGEKAAAFGQGVADGFGIIAKQSYDALGELFQEGMDFETTGIFSMWAVRTLYDLLKLSARPRWIKWADTVKRMKLIASM